MDPMALVLRLEQRKMGAFAKSAFDSMEAGATTIYVPGMVLAEVLYLHEKGRIGTSLGSVNRYLREFPHCVECPLSFAIAEAAQQITDIPDLHDRLIGSTALHLGKSLITNDPVIEASALVSTVW